MKKYELTNETINHGGQTLYRIKSLRNFSDVKDGQLGGYVQREENLSQSGNSWIYNEAMVYEKARVEEDAKVCDCAMVYGEATISKEAIVRRNAKVYESALITDYSKVCERAKVFGSTRLTGDTVVTDDAQVLGLSKLVNVIVKDNSVININGEVLNEVQGTFTGYAQIESVNDFIVIYMNLNGVSKYTFFRSKDGEVYVHTLGEHAHKLEKLVKGLEAEHGKLPTEMANLVNLINKYFEK